MAPRFSVVTPVYDTPAEVLGRPPLGHRPDVRRLGAPARRRPARRRRTSSRILDEAAAADPPHHGRPPRRERWHRRRRRTTASPPPRASSSPCSTTTTSCIPTRCAWSTRRCRPSPRPTTSTRTRTRSTSAAAGRAPSTSPTGRPSACAHRCTRATSASCAARWSTRSAAFGPTSRARRTGTWCCASPSGPARSSTCPTCSTTGACSPRPPPPAERRRSRTHTRRAPRALQAHCERIGFPAIVERDLEHSGVYHLRPRLTEHPSVSIVIPTNGGARQVRGEVVPLVVHCVRSIVETSTYPNFEIVVVADSSTPPDVLTSLREVTAQPAAHRAVRPRLQLLRQDQHGHAGQRRRPRAHAQRRHGGHHPRLARAHGHVRRLPRHRRRRRRS